MSSSAPPRTARWRAWTEGRGVLWLGVGLSFLLCAPSLPIGLIADDVVHARFLLDHLSGNKAPGAFWDMFDVVGRQGSAQLWWRVFQGSLPWWTSPSLRIAFFRPLSVASQYLDFALYPKLPWLMHLHNLSWYALTVCCAGLLYRRVLGRNATSGLALLLYAVDEAHADGAAWIASRNTLMTAAFVLMSLVLFDRARRDHSPRALAGSALALALGLLSSEGALAAWAYLVPYALFLDHGPWRGRLRALLPLAAVTLAFAVVTSALRYGVSGSGLYVDPRSDPWFFVLTMARRLPQTLAAQVGIPMELWRPYPQFETASLIVLVPALVLFGMQARNSRTARFFVFGMLASAVPVSAGGVAPRLLFLIGLGAHGVLAEVALAGLRRLAEPQRFAVLRKLGIALLLLLNGPLAVVTAPLTPRVWVAFDALVRKGNDSLPPPFPGIPTAVMVLNTTDYLVTMFVALYHMATVPPGSQLVHVLGASEAPVRVSRPDRNALVLEPQGGYLSERASQLVRKPTERFRRGQVIALFGLWAVIEEVTPDGRPARVRLQMLLGDDPRFRWVTWDNDAHRFVPVPLPEVGQSFWLPGARRAASVANERLR